MFQGAYGVTEKMPANDALDERVAELLINGFTVLPSGMDPGFIESLKATLDRAYKKQVAEIGSEEDLARINDADIVRCVLSYEPDFLQVATSEVLLEFATRTLGGEFILLMQNGLINRSDKENFQAKWHRDLNYQHWTASKPLAINALFCIDEFTTDNGATFVLPGTQNVAAFPTEAFTERFEHQSSVPAGSFLILNAMLFHRAGINTSGRLRRAVNHVVGLPFMAQQIDIPSALERAGIEPPKDARLRKYLNYDWAPSRDAAEWRRKRLVK